MSHVWIYVPKGLPSMDAMCGRDPPVSIPVLLPIPPLHRPSFSGKFYCPRMATMNKPTYAAIQVSPASHSQGLMV